MINEIKNIKMSQLSQEEIEIQYNSAIAKRVEELKELREKQGGTFYNRDEMVLEQEIIDLKKEDKEQWVKDKITNAKTLKDLGITFEEAIGMLRERNMPIVLTEEDRVITENESEFKDMSDLIFVHKTRYFPEGSTIKTSKDAGAYIEMFNELEIDGQNYEIGGKSERETIHFTLNAEVTWNDGALMRWS